MIRKYYQSQMVLNQDLNMMIGIIFTFWSLISIIGAYENIAQLTDNVEKRFKVIELRINQLEKQNIDLEMKVNSLEKDNLVLKGQNEKLQNENEEMKNVLNIKLVNEFLKKQNNKNVDEIIKLFNHDSHDIDDKTTRGDDQQGSISNIILHNQEELMTQGTQKQRITYLAKRLLLPGTPSQRTVPTKNAHVAFHARMTEKLSNPVDNQHIEFKGVTTNVGNAFNGDTGTFTCPVVGTYFFSVTILSEPDKRINTEIVRNGQNLVYTYSHNDNYFNSASAMVVVELQENDTVWVRVQGIFHPTGDVLHEDFSYFSGFILWPNH